MEIIVESSNRNKAKPTIGEIIEKFFNTKILGMSPDLYRAIKNSTIRRDCVQLSSKEKHLLELSYGFLKDKTNDNQASLSDIFEENCRCRCLILDKYDYFPTEKRLNKIIDRLSDDDVIKILFQGDKYIDCYSQYIKQNPHLKKQMIYNIKKSWKIPTQHTTEVYSVNQEINKAEE